MQPTSDPSTLWLSIAREAFAPERSAAEAAAALERLGHQRGLGGGLALGLRELISYASAVPDPAQGALGLGDGDYNARGLRPCSWSSLYFASLVQFGSRRGCRRPSR